MLEIRKYKHGIWSLIGSFHVLRALLRSNTDFIVIDFEHGEWRPDQLATAVAVCHHEGKNLVMRIPQPSQSWFQLAQDSGVDVLQIAGVRSQEDLTWISNQLSFPPKGILGYSPWSSQGLLKRGQNNFLPSVSIQIEEVNFLEEFLQKKLELAPQINSIFIGRYDLSISMGVPAEISHPEIMDYIVRAREITKELGLKLGTVSNSQNDAEKLVRIGVDYISLGSDVQRLSEELITEGK